MAALAMGLVGIGSGRRIYQAAAWIFALLPIGYALAVAIRRTDRMRPIMAGLALLLVGVLTASTLATTKSCTQRLAPKADLSGCDFTGEDLSGQNLKGSDLSDANLTEANLRNASLVNANLTGADLSGLDLTDTRLDLAKLDRVNLSGADLQGAFLSGLSMQGATATGANLEGALLSGTDLSDGNLDKAILGKADLSGADLSDASLGSATLNKADLSGADLGGADLQGTILRAAVLNRAKLDGAVLDGADLSGASLIDATGLDDADLATGLGVSLPGLAAALSEQRVQLEGRQEIFSALRPACGGTPVPAAAPFPQNQFHPMVILGGSGGQSTLTNKALNLGWEPTAVRFAQLVACVDTEQQTTLEVCPYEGGHTITRVQNHRRVRVVAARSARVVFDQTLDGTVPGACQFTEFFSTGVFSQTRSGSSVGFGAFQARLANLVS